MNDELRAKFEAWWTRESGTYNLGEVFAWKAWQVAHASRDAEIEALKREVDDLAALVSRLAHSLDKSSGNKMLARQALDYLRRHDLQGSPMREGK